MQKAKHVAAENHIVTSNPKGQSPSLSVFGSEKMGAGFVTVSLPPMSLQYQTGIFSIKHKQQDVLSCKSHPSRSKSIYRIAKVSSLAFSSRED